MHIWYVHHYAGGPGLGIHGRAYALARAWLDLGHSVTVFVAEFHHLLETQTPLPSEQVVEGVRYVAVPSRRYADNGAARLLNLFDFTRNLPAAGRREEERSGAPDAVIVSSPHPFAFLAAHRLARRNGATLVFEIRDLWPLSITEILGTSRLHPFVGMCAAAERFALTRADLVASVLPRVDLYLAERKWAAKAFVWVPNGLAARGEVQAPESVNALLAAEKLDEWRRGCCTTIVHAGSLGKPNAVDLLLRAVASGRARGEADDCRVLVLGSGVEAQPLRDLAGALGLADVHFAGRVAKGEVAALLEKSDIGYAGIRALDRLYRYGVSLNKFGDYFGAGLPVFLPIEPCGDPVSCSGGGIARRTPEPDAAWGALRELILMGPEGRRALGAKGKEYMAREYSYGGIAARYVEAIAQCASRPLIDAPRRRGRLRTRWP